MAILTSIPHPARGSAPRIRRVWRRYVFWLIGGFLALLATVFGLNILFLARTNEFVDFNTAVARVKKDGRALLFNGMTYGFLKEDGFRNANPVIGSIGSSRAFLVREQYFTQPFYNLGGSIAGADSLNANNRFSVLNIYFSARNKTTKLLFVFMDYWWFTVEEPNSTPSVIGQGQRGNGNGRTAWFATDHPLAKFIRTASIPTRLVMQNNLQMEQYFGAIMGRYPTVIGDIETFGIAATLWHNGFDVDVSYYYGLKAPEDAQCLSQMADFSGWGRVCLSGQRLDQGKLDEFREAVYSMKKHGVDVILIIPPVAPPAVKYLQQPEFAYVDEWRQYMRETFSNVWDFHDPLGLPSEPCEFIDVIHGGEVTYLRILKKIAADRPDLLPMLRMDRIDRTINENSGNRFVVKHVAE